MCPPPFSTCDAWSTTGGTVGENSGNEAVFAKTDRLIRTTVVWRGWDVAGPKANYLILSKL